MPIQSFAGKPAPRRPDPVVPVSNGNGVSPWSVFRAFYAKFSGSNLINELTVGNGLSGYNTSVNAVLFTSDVPAILTASALTNNSVIVSCPVINALNTSGILVTSLGGSTSVTIPAYGQVAQGYAGASKDVLCSGFPISGTVNGGAAGLQYYLDCVANGAIVNSPVGNIGIAAGSSSTAKGLGATPVILKSTDYTNAIKANNNIIEDVQSTYIVVGLYLAP